METEPLGRCSCAPGLGTDRYLVLAATCTAVPVQRSTYAAPSSATGPWLPSRLLPSSCKCNVRIPCSPLRYVMLPLDAPPHCIPYAFHSFVTNARAPEGNSSPLHAAKAKGRTPHTHKAPGTNLSPHRLPAGARAAQALRTRLQCRGPKAPDSTSTRSTHHQRSLRRKQSAPSVAKLRTTTGWAPACRTGMLTRARQRAITRR